MPNHVHLLMEPGEGCPLSRTMQGLQLAYTFQAHKRYRRVGHLWQDRFKASLSNRMPIICNLVATSSVTRSAAAWSTIQRIIPGAATEHMRQVDMSPLLIFTKFMRRWATIRNSAGRPIGSMSVAAAPRRMKSFERGREGDALVVMALRKRSICRQSSNANQNEVDRNWRLSCRNRRGIQ